MLSLRVLGIAVVAVALLLAALFAVTKPGTSTPPSASPSTAPTIPPVSLAQISATLPRILADAFGTPTAPTGIDTQGTVTHLNIAFGKNILDCELRSGGADRLDGVAPDAATAAFDCSATSDLPTAVVDGYDFSAAVIGEAMALVRPAVIVESALDGTRRIEIEGGRVLVVLRVDDRAIVGAIAVAPAP